MGQSGGKSVMDQLAMGSIARRRSALALLAAVMGLAACASDGPAYGPPDKDAAAVVELTSTLAFRPETVTIRQGQTVEWRNQSLLTHTVTNKAGKAADPTDVSMPAGAQHFSAEVPSGQVFRHAFTVPGTYRYVCLPHESLGMRGTVIVEPAG